jgi:hypothetical protein
MLNHQFSIATRFRPLALLAMVLAPISLWSTDLAVAGDAHVLVGRPATNFGYLSNLYVNNGAMSFLQFDLSALPAGTTASQIAAAKVTFFVNRVYEPGTINISQVTGSWTESGVTYNSAPSVAGTPTTSFTVATTSAAQFITVDITSLLQGWVASPSTNFGIALTSSAANILLDSKENDQTAHSANLTVTVSTTASNATMPLPNRAAPGQMDLAITNGIAPTPWTSLGEDVDRIVADGRISDRSTACYLDRRQRFGGVPPAAG